MYCALSKVFSEVGYIPKISQMFQILCTLYIVQYTYISTFIHDTGKKCCKEEGGGPWKGWEVS